VRAVMCWGLGAFWGRVGDLAVLSSDDPTTTRARS
jgi:hypothetical protein